MAPTTHVLDTPHLALLDRLVRRMADDGHADTMTRAAVDVLTAAAAPDRADRLALLPTEPPALVERLAAWALRRAPIDAVTHAERVLDGQVAAPAPAGATVARDLVAC